ncbi:hypothetical protein M407DRAFT_34236 [Tulasnella calospora MUT 4182]|uniref:Uncharacterized protein n=1 Tax=Tulasnella calospora MUT 4182 TaxID=1051891 RepID=A0A0C3Q0Z6_9AGAM|nr:hypothetical protein M407DRAFT_34236 [Tulasnella calospora MUT 4182]
MAPIRSEALIAAAPAVTRSGRRKKPTQAALRAVSTENHEAQQARRSRTGGRRANVNTQGQAIAAGTPKVSPHHFFNQKRPNLLFISRLPFPSQPQLSAACHLSPSRTRFNSVFQIIKLPSLFLTTPAHNRQSSPTIH